MNCDFTVFSLSWEQLLSIVQAILYAIIGLGLPTLAYHSFSAKRKRDLNDVKERLEKVFSKIHSIGERSRNTSYVTNEDMENITKILDSHPDLIHNGWYRYRNTWEDEKIMLRQRPSSFVDEKPAFFITQTAMQFFDWTDAEYYYLLSKRFLGRQNELKAFANWLLRKLGLGRKVVEISPGVSKRLQVDLVEGIAVLYADENVSVAQHYRIKIDSDAYRWIGEQYFKSMKKKIIVLHSEG